MSKEWQTVKQAEANWILDRPIIKENNTLYRVVEMLRKEVMELVVATGYHTLNPTEVTRKDVLQEASDVGIFLMAIFRLLEADMLDEFMEKIALNTCRYPAVEFQEGKHSEIYQRLKKKNKQEGVVEQFYE